MPQSLMRQVLTSFADRHEVTATSSRLPLLLWRTGGRAPRSLVADARAIGRVAADAASYQFGVIDFDDERPVGRQDANHRGPEIRDAGRLGQGQPGEHQKEAGRRNDPAPVTQ